ncbi:hypothetical protein CK203_015892 [Vitis vinifera]|uniref:Uncharacterized protein n=1 Tax=Vitis vinifera TaxID=29760 RepID=A0A438JRP6_VITVI|nr:hypothetical protein CK203_015892 [Vitis vinifera]
MVELVDLEEGEFSISCQFKNCVDRLVWVFTGVYGPVCSKDREDFWEELGSIKGLWSDPWCVGGDFNLVRYPEERSRGGGLTASMSSEAEGLETHFSKEEVFAAPSDLGNDKAPGLDGFTMLFVLVPKKGGAENLKDFRPISLMESLYKLLAKVLANKIKKVMEKVILKSQNAFVEGRQILNAVLIANEAVDSKLKSNQGGLWGEMDKVDRVVHLYYEIFGSNKWFSFRFFPKVEGIETRRPSLPLSVCDSHGGLRVNLEKSELIPVGKVHDIEDLALELGCKVGGLPSCFWVCLWGPPSNQRWFGMVLKSGFEKGLQCGRDNAFWKQVINLKYGEEEGGWCTQVISLPSGLWKESEILERTSGVEMSLFVSHSLLYCHLLGKDVWSPRRCWDGWTPLFSRAFNDWEIEMVERFMLKIQAFRVQREDEEKVVWTTSKSGAFLVK